MKQSLSYYITIWVIKLMGLKKIFSTTPIPYHKLRKHDCYQPKSRFFKQKGIQQFTILNTGITEINIKKDNTKLLLFIHGGAFVSGPVQHHWDVIKKIAQTTNYNTWLCNYPKAPENDITKITDNIHAVYKAAVNNYGADNIALIGDSAGGTLATLLIQQLVQQQLKLPKKIILISPVMDVSLTNPDIVEAAKKDVMLSMKGVISAKKMCAQHISLKSPLISPLYGSFTNFPKTLVVIAENDIMYPDAKLAIGKLQESHTDLEIIEGKNMPHIWPYLPVMKEAKITLKKVIDFLNE